MAKDKRSKIIAVAFKLAKQSKIDAAIKEYEKILQFKPDDLEIRRIIGDLHYNQKNLPDAVSQFDWIADFYRQEGFHAKAIAMLKRVTKIDPSNEKVSFKLAELYSAQGLMIEAKQIYLDLAEEHKRKNDIKSALKMYEKILEFDSGNINMRLLLAENYLKENMKEDAVKEYLIVSDILIRKKEFTKIEDLLSKVISKVKNEKIIEKLASSYTKQGKLDKAIEFLQSFGSEIYEHLNLLKILGDLFFDKGLIKESEQIYLKIIDINSEETEVIMKLGRVYMNRKEFDKTYYLFVPVVDKYIKAKKYEEAIGLLRFILTANNSFTPVREKMAEIFRTAKKKNNLIKVLESLIPIYDAEKKIIQLKSILTELVALSDSPYEYENKLKELEGNISVDEKDEISADDEFMSHNYRKVEESLKISDFVEAENILLKMKEKFPGNLNISLKLFDLYERTKNKILQIEEGYVILGLYKLSEMDDEYSELLEKLTKLDPDSIVTQNLVANERTDINIEDIAIDDIEEELREMNPSLSKPEILAKPKDEDTGIFELTDEDSVILPADEVKEQISASSKSDSGIIDPDEITKIGADSKKSLDEMLKELNFYLSSKFFDEADKLITDLQKMYPGNDKVNEIIQRYNKEKEINKVNVEFEQEPVKKRINIDLDGGITDEIDTSAPFSMDYTESDSKSDSGVLIEITDPPYMQEKKDEIPEIELKTEDEVVAEPFDSKVDIHGISDVFNDNETAPKESDTKPPFSDDPPFDEATDQNIFGELDEDDIFDKDPVLFDTNDYYELENIVKVELEAITFWLKELEMQRTSTIEKNMMEIFEEFKKGVEKNIGQDDYDTRYNLGIAYKEMGLLEEAIHEFLISSKHPLKIFDSAGLLGICFRDKGMYSESINWFKKALGISDRQEDEFLNIKYELISCYELSDDIDSAKELAKEIMEINPDFRDIKKIHNKLISG